MARTSGKAQASPASRVEERQKEQCEEGAASTRTADFISAEAPFVGILTVYTTDQKLCGLVT
ncbi:hypothetical protein GCM10009093_15720 [Brevundimonas terrae]|uniref:Uncharacterized protein n=1 Tax=Brevundimonas terrae TaxID=363631 RepID=A0ABP3I4F4_9CAUL